MPTSASQSPRGLRQSPLLRAGMISGHLVVTAIVFEAHGFLYPFVILVAP
jgi:hypothetical protein